MSEILRPQEQAEIITAPPEDVQALGYLGVRDELNLESTTAESAENALSIAETANHQGNWMLAQQERMYDLDFKTRYKEMVDESLSSLKEGVPGVLDKPENFQDYHQALDTNFNERSERVHAAVGYAPAKEHGLSPHQTGRGSIGEQGVVFSDATTMEGAPLTDKQKDIIAAHEAYHGMIKAPASVRSELGSAFDDEIYNEIVDRRGLKQPNYLRNPDELMARMAQLKNYFGMKGGEEFTKDHLEYARSHYVEDTGLDNSMSVMFMIISPKTETGFLRAMNKLPI